MRATWRTALLGAVAALNILSTLLPLFARRYLLVVRHLPVALILGAQHAVLLLGVTMLLLAHPAAHSKVSLMLCFRMNKLQLIHQE